MTDPSSKSNNAFVLPNTGSMLAPSSLITQKLGSTGSATGNPRNKCALQPGHSLMDWIRLGNSGVDLAGTQGRVTPVTSEDLAQHNKREDAWLAIRGKVYNVTRYMDFHPGGVEELMRGVGRDATKLFDEVHAWVNYQQLLAKCYIGPLRTLAKMKSIEESQRNKTQDFFAKPPAVPIEVIPRFDWIQRRSDLNLYIYTRQFCNPGIMLQCKSDKELLLKIQIGQQMHRFEIELQQRIEWPPKALRVASETGKIEVLLSKIEPELWTSYGAHKMYKELSDVNYDALQYEFEVHECEHFNHDSVELCLQGLNNTIMMLPVGYHISMGALINGELIRRSYTPINVKYLHSPHANEFNLNFLIKSYSSGLLSSHLGALKSGAMLLLSPARGSLQLSHLLKHRQIALLAAGSGLTPCLSVIDHLLRRSTNRVDYLYLMYFNKTEEDIWCRGALERLQSTEERFRFVNVLSQPSDDWSGLKGHISADLLTPLITKSGEEQVTFIAVCGPNAFNQMAESLLKELKFNSNNLHVFQG